MTEFTDNDYTESYTYDNAGNMLSKDINGTATTYNYNAGNQLTEEVTNGATIGYSYDANGDLIEKTTGEKYTYDIQGNLTTISGNGIDQSFSYNGNGNRLSKTVDGETTYFVNDVNRAYEQVLQTYNDDGVIDTYTYGLQRIQSVGETTETYLYDGRGSVVGAVGSDNSVVAYAYTAYGELIPGSPTPSTFGFNGEATDYSTGLQYLRARYYDTSVQRFVQEDDYRGRFGELQTMNRYVYAGCNPIMSIDPSGYWETPQWIKNAKDKVVNKAKDIVEKGKEKIESAKNTILKTTNDLYDNFTNKISTFKNNVVKKITTYKDNFMDKISDFGDRINTGIDKIGEEMTEGLNNLKNNFINFGQEALDAGEEFVHRAGDLINRSKEEFSEALDYYCNLLHEKRDEFIDWWTQEPEPPQTQEPSNEYWFGDKPLISITIADDQTNVNNQVMIFGTKEIAGIEYSEFRVKSEGSDNPEGYLNIEIYNNTVLGEFEGLPLELIGLGIDAVQDITGGDFVLKDYIDKLTAFESGIEITLFDYGYGVGSTGAGVELYSTGTDKEGITYETHFGFDMADSISIESTTINPESEDGYSYGSSKSIEVNTAIAYALSKALVGMTTEGLVEWLQKLGESSGQGLPVPGLS